MILYIDTTDFNSVTYATSQSGKIKKRTYKIDPYESYKILASLEDFLRPIQNHRSIIKKIIVNKGPGSYTGTRIGITHALALGFSWHIPVKPLAKDKFMIH